MSSATMYSTDRVKHGLAMESKIATSLQKAGLNIQESTNREDILKKVDRWIVKNGVRTPLQIKFRESGEDVLFEVYDTFVGWNNPKNKTGRDMEGIATQYAVLIRNQIVMIPVALAKEVINEMLSEVRVSGWTKKGYNGATLHYRVDGHDLQLKLQSDPYDGRQKMVAYIPAEFFQRAAQVYRMSA